MENYWFVLIAILVLIVLSAFFSGSETALTAVSRSRMHQLAKKGDKRASLVINLIEKRDRLIGALLIGNNLVNILASALATSFFINFYGESGVVIATVVMTVVVVVFAEVMPKSWAITNADKFATSVSPIVRIIVLVFSPLTYVMAGFVRRVLRLFGIQITEEQSLLSAHDELRGTMDILHKEGSIIKDDKDRLDAILDLHDLDVGDVMIHRTAMESINIDDASEKIVKQILASPYTRIPIWRDEVENIIGVVHAKDVLRSIASGKRTAKTLDIMKIAAKPWFVPETTSLQAQLNAFLRNKAHIALVVDEYGEVEGIVTLEDILEEIVGEIADEHDVEVAGVVPQPDGSYLIDGIVPVRDINRALDWELPEDEATTVAGLVIHEAQMIPEEKQTFTFYKKRFVVTGREKNRITQLRIRDL
ncbi:MAG: HlyC/CorC family transporter [Rhizobiaceae bacterium]|nr:HlyC/CorC family transporter [Rhizobiaceae bacterium]